MSDPGVATVTGAQPQTVVATVSGNDLLMQLTNQASTLARIETRVDNLPATIEAVRVQSERNTEAIGQLMQWRSFWIGVTTVVTLLLTSGVVAAIIAATRR